MIYAALMLAALLALIAFWRDSRTAMPLFLIALLATALAFAADVTDPLSISL